MTRVGIVLFDGAEELDFVGPWEVFTMASKEKEGDLEVVTVSRDGGQVRCAKGLRVLADHSFASAPHLDILLVPGGEGTRREMEDARTLGWLRERAPQASWLTSVCTGTLVLHAAGLCEGRRVTTHWALIEMLRTRGQNLTVLENVRYVRDGNLVTAAGVSAGIDMALWLVGQLRSPALARRVQRLMEYDPAPPYAAEV